MTKAEDRLEPRLNTVDHDKIEAAVRDILAAIGEDPERDGLLDTPARVARMYACLLYTSPSPRDRQKSRMPSSA